MTIEKYDKTSVTAKIKKAEKDFEGNFWCYVETDKNNNRSDLQIFYFNGHFHDLKLEVHSIDGKKENDFNKGESIRIRCSADTSSIDNTISIIHDDHVLDIFNTNGELKIKWSIFLKNFFILN